MVYKLLVLENYRLYNFKGHEIWRRLVSDDLVQKVRFSDGEKIPDYIRENDNTGDITLVYFYSEKFILSILDYIESTDVKSTIVFITFDYWHGGSEVTTYEYVRKRVFKAKKHKVITFARCLEELQVRFPFDLSSYKDNIYHFNLWCSYNDSFLPLNENPVNKIAVSGEVSRFYPERVNLLRYKNVEQLAFIRGDDTSYSKRLNRYLCCFTTSVHVWCYNARRLTNTHLVLQKTFEILAAGCLLLCPESEKPFLEKIGLIANTHYYILPAISALWQGTIDYLIDPKNRHHIDDIRRKGQNYAREKLNSAVRYVEFCEILRDVGGTNRS